MKFSDVPAAGITIRESADDGSDFTNPAADYRRLFLGEDGALHLKDSSGTVTDVAAAGGDVATDAIFDAKGDLAVGTGANTAAKLTVGANGTRPEAASGETTGLKWSYPPGYELDYAEFTSAVNITATTEATADTVVTGNAVTYDGSTAVLVEFFAPHAAPTATAAKNVLFWLYDGSSSIGALGAITTPATGTLQVPISVRRKLTPSNASHTYSIRCSVNTATGVVTAGAGGAGAYFPGFIRITKV
jgi:hypothetical protein